MGVGWKVGGLVTGAGNDTLQALECLDKGRHYGQHVGKLVSRLRHALKTRDAVYVLHSFEKPARSLRQRRPTLLVEGSMLAPTAAAALSSGSNWRGGGTGWRRSSAHAGK